MQSKERQRTIILALCVAMLLLAGDRLILSPFMDMRDELLLDRDNAVKDVVEANRVLNLEQQLRPLSKSLASSLGADPSAAESQVLHLLHQWQQHAGVANASFQRLRSTQSQGYTCLTFNITATGGMASVAGLLYKIETASIPLRIENFHLTPRHDGADDLQLRMNLSTLARGTTATSANATVVANLDAAGGQP